MKINKYLSSLQKNQTHQKYSNKHLLLFFNFISFGLSYSQDSLNIKNKELTEIIVKTSSIDVSLTENPRFIYMINSEDLKKINSNSSIQEILNSESFIDIRQRGAFGVQADVSIRGSNFNQSAFLINGINFSNPNTGHNSFDLPFLFNQIKSINIISGSSAGLLSSNSLAGAININTQKKLEEKFGFYLSSGSYGFLSSGINSGFKTSKSNHLISLSYNKSDGYIENTDFKSLKSFFINTFDLNNIYIELQSGFTNKNFGAQDFYTPIYPNQFEKTKSFINSLKIESKGKIKLVSALSYSNFLDEFQLFRDGLKDIPSWYKNHNFHNTNVFGMNNSLQYKSKLGFTSISNEIKNDQIESNVLGIPKQNLNNKYNKQDKRTSFSYFVEHILTLNKLKTSVGILANKTNKYDDHFGFYPNINIKYSINKNLDLYSSYSKSFRLPTFTELYYTTVTHIGNSNLKSEKSESYELGFVFKKKKFESKINAFYINDYNLIDWVKYNINDKWESANITNITRKGIETKINLDLSNIINQIPKNTNINLSYSYLDKKQNQNFISNFVLDNLKHKFIVQSSFNITKNTNLAINYRFNKRQGNFQEFQTDKTFKNRDFKNINLIDLKMQTKIKNIIFETSFNNILNKSYFDLGNVVQPGFWFTASLLYKIN